LNKLIKPISIKKANPSDLTITWDNGHESKFTLDHLRKICPCAGCQGEDILLHHHPGQPMLGEPECYLLISIQPVGAYAIQLQWADGHNSGIYTWDHLLVNCQCKDCAGKAD
jgi:DUF971 family protein